MAANYWDSSQAKHWTFSKTQLAEMRSGLEKNNAGLHGRYAVPDRRLMSIYFQQNVAKLGRRMNVRQQALATAQVYIRRFYLCVELRKTNPYLIMATAVYLACKTEECPHHIRLMLGEAARQWPDLGVTETNKIGECEFALISTLSSRLILHHPYRTLAELAPLFGLGPEEQSLAHGIVNDSYNTDLCLIYPPHVIAITAIFLAVVLQPPGGGHQHQHQHHQHHPSNAAAAAAAAASTSSIPSSLSSSSPHVPSQTEIPFPTNASLSGTANAPAAAGPTGTLARQQQSNGMNINSNINNNSITNNGATLSAAAANSALLNLKQSAPKLGKLVDWLAETNVDMAAVVNATQEMVSLYDVWESYSERACKEAISRWMNNLAK